ncbi:hypothetical protein [Actinoplanes sp. NBRC 103695]|uniref:hypothetical protein n=1 Tax=Actinoplanes sp. NBRC 103695 TaxID=3032202 RepID=UPI0024A0958C|nr:hypothetical protein [Actinoplanes sp. NBRC 103695]GLY96760.1 hypothetical protein Acsp02_40140 [Actinoplanes sp. NBRC 103695]
MTLTLRLAHLLLRAAARRWPPDISADLLREWQAELSAAGSSRFQILGYAGSLAVAPTADGPSWATRFATVATAAGATLLAGALSNAVHATTAILLLPAALLMALAAWRARMSPAAAVLLLTPPLFVFLFIGNAVSVMPFMGFQDVAPAVATWAVAMLATIRLLRRVPALLLGSTISLIAATAAGSLHAAHSLGVSLWSAPMWFPLSLLPPETGHASALLLANAAVMTTPLLLCTVFVLALALPRRTPTTTRTPGRAVVVPTLPRRALTTARATGRAVVVLILGEPGSPRRQATLGAATALAAVAVCEATLLATADPTALAGRVLDHSAVFGFGFAAHPTGQAVTALLAAALTLRLTEPATPR